MTEAIKVKMTSFGRLMGSYEVHGVIANVTNGTPAMTTGPIFLRLSDNATARVYL